MEVLALRFLVGCGPFSLAIHNSGTARGSLKAHALPVPAQHLRGAGIPEMHGHMLPPTQPNRISAVTISRVCH